MSLEPGAKCTWRNCRQLGTRECSSQKEPLCKDHGRRFRKEFIAWLRELSQDAVLRDLRIDDEDLESARFCEKDAKRMGDHYYVNFGQFAFST